MKIQFSEEWWSLPVGLLIQVTASKVAFLVLKRIEIPKCKVLRQND